MGLEFFNDGIIISYGEGDERSKIIHFSFDEVSNMLKDISFVSPFNFHFRILKYPIKYNKILILHE